MNNLVQVIQQIAEKTNKTGKPTGIVYGEVMTVDPLSIQVEQKLTLPAEFFKLTNAVRDHYVDITVSHVTEDRAGGSSAASFASHNHDYSGRKKILVHNGLRVGEQVILIQAQGGQDFIILDRVFDLITEGEWL